LEVLPALRLLRNAYRLANDVLGIIAMVVAVGVELVEALVPARPSEFSNSGIMVSIER
jgi:hypothetical protein